MNHLIGCGIIKCIDACVERRHRDNEDDDDEGERSSGTTHVEYGRFRVMRV